MTDSLDPGKSGYYDSNGLRLHYLTWGEPSSRAFVLLHGIRGYARTWVQTANLLANRYYIIGLDQRGRGESEWSPTADYYTEAYVTDLEQLVNHLHLEHFVMLGHSMGGTNSLVYSYQHPRKLAGLIIEDIGPGSSTEGDGASRVVREFSNTPTRFDSWADATEFWRVARPNVPEEAINSRVEETLTEGPDGDIEWRFDFEGIKTARLAAAKDTSKLPDLWPCIDALSCPTLLIKGANSDFLAKSVASEMVERNPNIELVEIPRATHYVHDDNFDDFFSTLSRFLDKIS